MDKILVFIDWYLPGTSAGGPVRSVANVTDHLGGEFHFSILTRNSDYCSTEPYPGITPDAWTLLNDHTRVCYLSPGKENRKTLQRLIRETLFDVAWINGIYSWKFSILPLFLLRGKGYRVVVSPRGMLNPQAFTSGKLKKKIFILLARWWGLFKGVEFHATNEDERKNILQQLGEDTQVIVAPNLPAKLSRKYEVGSRKYAVSSKEDEVGREENPHSAFRNPQSTIRNPQSENSTSDSTPNTEHLLPAEACESIQQERQKRGLPKTDYRLPVTGYRLSERSGDPASGGTEYRIPHTEHRIPVTEYRSPVTCNHKAPGSLKLVSVARISPEKGTLHALRFLKELKEGNIQFDLYGPVYNEAYWKECRQVIASLPSNVTVTWHGPAGGEQIREALSGAHFLLMPSEGENFGHSILEALSEGVPVIISDRTPWRKLEARKAGFDLSLEDHSAFIGALHRVLAMEEAEFQAWSSSAFKMAVEYTSDETHMEASRKLFRK